MAAGSVIPLRLPERREKVTEVAEGKNSPLATRRGLGGRIGEQKTKKEIWFSWGWED
jgi:hypothetical protein